MLEMVLRILSGYQTKLMFLAGILWYDYINNEKFNGSFVNE